MTREPTENEIIAACVHLSAAHRDMMIDAARQVGRLSHRDDGAPLVDTGDAVQALDELFIALTGRQYLEMLGRNVELERIVRIWLALAEHEIAEPDPALLAEIDRTLAERYRREGAR